MGKNELDQKLKSEFERGHLTPKNCAEGLLDELNKLFTSKNVEDVIKFYDHFDTAEQLIEWMKNRPSAPMKIYEVEGDKDIVVVIPTANHEGELAKNCANNIFKGQQIIFVESNGPFFNYARSCNYGLKYALKYNPKWVVLSNDDMYKIDEFSVLKNNLLEINDAAVVFVTATTYHSHDITIYKQRLLLLLYRHINRYNSIGLKLFKKYNIKLLVRHAVRRIFMNPVYTFKLTGDFQIFSYNLVKNTEIFDQNFINSMEDVDFSYKLSKEKIKSTTIDFRIGDYIGKSLGSGIERTIRNISNLAYFNKKLNQKLFETQKR